MNTQQWTNLTIETNSYALLTPRNRHRLATLISYLKLTSCVRPRTSMYKGISLTSARNNLPNDPRSISRKRNHMYHMLRILSRRYLFAKVILWYFPSLRDLTKDSRGMVNTFSVLGPWRFRENRNTEICLLSISVALEAWKAETWLFWDFPGLRSPVRKIYTRGTSKVPEK